jgi:hypothetical protein
MKYFLLYLQIIFSCTIFPQSLQFHYDFRHSLDPKLNSENFPTLFFQDFQQKDYGSLLIQMQCDFTGEKNNIGKFYTQISQTIKFWKPEIYLQFGYSGGFGVIKSINSAYYITNAFSGGVSYPLQWEDAWFNLSLCYTLNTFKLPSHDMLFSLYWGKGIMNYKIEFAGDFEIYTLNKNHGDEYTSDLHGKRFSFFAEPQIWFNLFEKFSIGSKINIYYHVISNDNIFAAYPTLAVRYKL